LIAEITYMPHPDQSPVQNVTPGEVEQLVAMTDNTRKLQLVPTVRKPARRKRDLGERLKSILVDRFRARGFQADEAEVQAELCFLPKPAPRYKVVAIR
jgi:hypothetical protein